MKVYKLSKQGEIAGLSYQPNNVQQVQEKDLYFMSVEGAEKHLTEKLGNLPANAGNDEYRVYRTHMGQYVLETVDVAE